MRLSRRSLIAAGVITTLGAGTGTALAASAPAGLAANTTNVTAPTSTTASSVPACHTSNLMIWRAAPSDGTTGGTYYELELSNVGSSRCSLDGYPRVVAVDRHGNQIGSRATHDTFFTAKPIVLAPRETAHAVLRITDTGVLSSASCQPATAAGLKVYPPSRPKGEIVPLRFRACSTSQPYMTVRVVRARTGIPGVSQ